MPLKSNALNYKLNTSIWVNLTKRLTNLLKNTIEVIFPHEWNETYYNWYQEIEKLAFRENLRYSFEEVKERLKKKDLFFLFIISDSDPEAFILGYSLLLDSKKIFFLDTIAVKRKNQGIGTILLNYLTEWLKKEKYFGIKVYTEEIDEKKIRLQDFYEKQGFKLEAKEPNGNLSMILWF
ncbi:MAG: GNAT family N-acetyltransferase [Candidatus Thorarchaeota archaeon]